MSTTKSCFFAYPSKPLNRSEVIENGIKRINLGKTIEIHSWKESNISGKLLITQICKDIENTDFFACDITCLNQNVLFELGYAIAKNKRIWMVRDPSVSEKDNNYKKLQILDTIGYSGCTNSEQLEEKFYKDRPYTDLDNTIFKEVIEKFLGNSMEEKLLYLKSSINTEASIALSRRINNSKIPTIIDDPEEVQTRTFYWYIQNIFFSNCVLVHLIPYSRQGWELHNAKYSLFSGIAYGFNKPLLMLNEVPYDSPVDYKDLVKIHRTAKESLYYLEAWLSELEKKYEEKINIKKIIKTDIKRRIELKSINIGDYVAENESDNILDYFVETSAYVEAMRGQQSIFVGRKGIGKTANLYKIANEFESDKRNHICIIKPVAYELEGVLGMLGQSIPKSEQGFLIESFWKFLIYTELAKSITEKIDNFPSHYQLDENEEKLVDFVSDNNKLINSEFSIRLETAVKSLCEINTKKSSAEQRIKISEILHKKIIGKLIRLLGEVLIKKNKVIILVDNLDKTWQKRDDLDTLSQLLFGLLRITKVIKKDFKKFLNIDKKIDLQLIIFLRSDIFNYIMRIAREPDKMNYQLLDWNNKDLLLRVIEDRFYTINHLYERNVWEKYFCDRINGKPTKEYILERIIPRPRDIIYICKASIDEAINSGHSIVEKSDLLNGEKKYSQYVFDSLLVENGIKIDKLENILFEFLGSDEILLEKQISLILKKADVEENAIGYVIDVLLDLNFLGLEISKGHFIFLYNQNEKQKYLVLARKYRESKKNKECRYSINKAFHSYLEINEIT